MKSKLLLCIVSSWMTILIYGQTTGDYRSKQSGNWNAAASWERFDGVNWAAAAISPTSTDGVITIRAGHGITISANTTADQITVATSGSITMNADLVLNDGTGDDLTINGTMHFNTGRVSSPGNMVVTNGGILNLGSNQQKLIGASITNNGTMNWSDGTIYFRATGILISNAGTFNITGNNSLQNEGTDPQAAGILANSGTINKTSTGLTDFLVTAVNNSGTVNINAGTLQSRTTFTNTGNLSFSNGAFTNGANSVFNHNTGSVIAGTGSFTNDGTMNLNINQTFASTLSFAVGSSSKITEAGNLTINNNFVMQGDMEGTGTLTINGNTTWNGGSLKRQLTIGATRSLTLTTGNPKLIFARITNNGTMEWQNGTIYFRNTGTLLENLGAFNITGNNALMNEIGAAGTFENSGTMTKTSNSTTDFQVSSVINFGTINLNAGVLQNRSSPFTNQGNLNFNNGSFINVLNNTFNHNTGSTIGGTGSFTNDGTLNLNINQTFPSTLSFAMGSSSLTTGQGNLTINNDFIMQGTISGTGSLAINANITWNSGGIYRALTVAAANTLNFANTNDEKQIGAALTSNGTMSWANGTIRFKANVTLTNAGTFTITGNNAFPNTITNENNISGTFVNSGTITMNSVDPTNFQILTINNNNAIIKGVGTVGFAGTFTNNGIIAPGLSPGILTVNDQQPFSANSALSIEIAGNGGAGQPTGHDQLQRSGNLTLNGILTINETGTVPAGDYTIISLTSGTITGTFSNPNLAPDYSIIYNTNNVVARKAPATCVPAVSIAANPGNTICSGVNVTFTATPTNGGSPSYQWKLNGNNVGTNSNTYSNSALANGDQISVVMTSSLACASPTTATSNTIAMIVTATVTPSVSIAANPGTTICAGTNVIFTATPTNGGTPSYQWKLNGNNVGTNSNTYSNSGLANGDQISVVMTSSLACAGPTTATSNTVTMAITASVVPSISIAANPGTTVCQFTPVTFTATPTNGGATPSYQWKLNGNNVGTNSNTYSINSVPNGAEISCVMTSSLACASPVNATSNTLQMTVTGLATSSVSITSNAGNTICAGTNVTFTATPTNGGNPPTYQWKLNGSNVGTNSNTYSNSGLVNGDQVAVFMTSSLTCVFPSLVSSNLITMTVTSTVAPSVSISANPGNTICAGTNVIFTATPTNGGTPSYQWKLNGNNVGTNSNTYSNNALANNDQVSCVMTSSLACASPTIATSNTVTMAITASVVPSISIEANPGTTVCQFTPVTFTATPTNGGANPSYQWKLNGNNVGTNSNTYSINSVPNGAEISCVMTSSLACASPATATSNTLHMTVTPLVTASVSISSNQGSTICGGTNVTFTATPTNGGATPTYRWYLNGNIVGTNSNTYSNSSLVNGDQVVVSMTPSLTCVFPSLVSSNAITMTVTATVAPSVSIAANPGNTICGGTNVTFTATPVNGGSPSYQWKLNGNNVGTNSNTYSNSGLANGDQVSCVMTSSLACANPLSATSNSIVISIGSGNINAMIVVIGNKNRCPQTLQANPGGDVNYQWYKNGIQINGATDRRYIANSNGSYSVSVTKNGCSEMSSAIDIASCPLTQTNAGFTKEGFVSISENDLLLYPNPATDHTTIDLQLDENIHGEAMVQVVTSHGQVLLTQKLNVVKGKINCRLKIDSRWRNELYLVKVIMNKQVYVGKLIKLDR